MEWLARSIFTASSAGSRCMTSATVCTRRYSKLLLAVAIHQQLTRKGTGEQEENRRNQTPKANLQHPRPIPNSRQTVLGFFDGAAPQLTQASEVFEALFLEPKA